MTDRYVDKQIKVLEFICKENFREDAITSSLLKITDNELEKILGELQWSNLLKVRERELLNSGDEHRSYDDILIYYLVMNKDGLANLLARLKKNYPRHSKTIIQEKILKKISRRFKGITTREEIIELLQEWGVPKVLIEYHPTECETIFSALNYYALSAKKEDYSIFAKIMEGLVHPFMFGGNREKSQTTIDNFNCLIEEDKFVIKDGCFQRIGKDDSQKHNQLHKKNSPEKIAILEIPERSHEEYAISVKDREIWINNYFISKPHAVGSNLEFFLYLLDNPNKEIKKSELPTNLKNQISKKNFSKILNALGFKGEILKTFFPKRSKSILSFKQRVNHNYLVERGIKEDILLKELRLAHTKNNPK